MLKQITPTYKKNPYLKKFRNRMKRKPTRAELAMGNLLKECRIKFSRQVVFIDGQTKYIADFWLWEYRTIVECDGEYHTWNTDNDAKRDADFAIAGIRTLRITNKQVFKLSPIDLKRLLSK